MLQLVSLNEMSQTSHTGNKTRTGLMDCTCELDCGRFSTDAELEWPRSQAPLLWNVNMYIEGEPGNFPHVSMT